MTRIKGECSLPPDRLHPGAVLDTANLSLTVFNRKLPRCRHRLKWFLRAIQVVARHSTSATPPFTEITS